MSTFVKIPANARAYGTRKPIFGVGINDADYLTQHRIDGVLNVCPYYSVWKRMLQRSYYDSYCLRYPTYINCIVCDEWLTFSNFKQWMEQQDWEGNVLDKDLKGLGLKKYSPDTCLFISSELNQVIIVAKGYHEIKRNERVQYMARCHIQGERKYLGTYDTALEAKDAYLSAKISEIIRHADSALDISTHIHNYIKYLGG